MVAIAIIGTLASSAFFALNPGGQLAKGRDAQRKSDMEQIKNALDIYYSDYNLYPSSLSILSAVVNEQTYIKKVPQDPLSTQSYCYESDGGSYRLNAKLERSSDPQINSSVTCNNTGYNYAVTSTNTSVIAFGLATPTPIIFPTSTSGPTPASAPTSTPRPTLTPTPTITLTPTPTRTPTPTPTPTYRRVFVTNSDYNGNLGGLNGADAKCQTSASTAALGGAWKAWLSDSSNSPEAPAPPRTFTKSTVPYKLVDETLIAHNWTDLITNKGGGAYYLTSAINMTENRGTMSSESPWAVWTNTLPSGGRISSDSRRTCNDWNTSVRYGSAIGVTSFTSFQWTDNSLADNFRVCSYSYHLYCFEQ